MATAGSAAYSSAVAVLGVLTAAFLLVVFLARLDFLADLISQPVLAGFLSGVGVSLVVGNLPAMLGIETSGGTWDTLVATASNLGAVNGCSAALGVGTVVTMLLVERWIPKVPAALTALVSFSLLGHLVSAADRGVAMVGSIPSGLPGLAVPHVQGIDIARMAPAAASIALVVLAQSAAVSRSFALKNGYPVSVRQDMAGLAVANLGSAFTSGFAINGSPPRTAAGDEARGQSQLINVVMALSVSVVLLVMAGLVVYVPATVLDAVVFTIGPMLVKVRTLREVGAASRSGLVVALITLVVVAFVGVEQGVLLAVVLALVDRLRRQYHPHDEVLVRDGVVAPRLESRVSLRGAELDAVLVFRFSAPLFFENATYFAQRVRELVGSAHPPVRRLVIDAAAMEDIDYTGARTLAELAHELRESGAGLILSETSEEVVTMIERMGLAEDVRIVARIEQALSPDRGDPPG